MLFVGINPGIRSALTGHHFAGYSNGFWKLLFDARLVPESITYEDDDRLPEWGYGITNIVPRATSGINELRPDEYIEGAAVLLRKIRRYQPEYVALVGVTVWRALLAALGDRSARAQTVKLGLQRGATVERAITAPGARPAIPPRTSFFVLPNPSGRNANYSYEEMLAAFRGLKKALK